MKDAIDHWSCRISRFFMLYMYIPHRECSWRLFVVIVYSGGKMNSYVATAWERIASDLTDAIGRYQKKRHEKYFSVKIR